MSFQIKVLNALERFLAKRLSNISYAIGEIKKYRYFLEFEEREDDIFIITFLKSGTTWMQMILYQLLTDGNDDFEHIYEVSPWISNEALHGKDVAHVNGLPSPRIIKTHDPYHNFDSNAKQRFIYVYRDGKDVAVSLLHHIKNYNRPDVTFEDIFKEYFSPDQEYNWFTFTKNWLANANKFNILYVKYEDLKLDFDATLDRIALFLNAPLTDEIRQRVKEKSSFQYMKQHESKFGEQPKEKDKRIYDQFIRSGNIGEGKEHFNEEQEAIFEKMFNDFLRPYAQKLK